MSRKPHLRKCSTASGPAGVVRAHVGPSQAGEWPVHEHDWEVLQIRVGRRVPTLTRRGHDDAIHPVSQGQIEVDDFTLRQARRVIEEHRIALGAEHVANPEEGLAEELVRYV